jgi:hypothetical protein
MNVSLNIPSMPSIPLAARLRSKIRAKLNDLKELNDASKES